MFILSLFIPPVQLHPPDMLHLQLLPLMPADAVYRRYRHVYRQTAEAGEHDHHADEPYIGRHPSAQIAESVVYPVRHVPDPFFQSVHFLSFLSYRSMVLKSRFSTILNCSIVKPCGLLSDLTEFNSRQRVTRLRSVMLLDLTSDCRA